MGTLEEGTFLVPITALEAMVATHLITMVGVFKMEEIQAASTAGILAILPEIVVKEPILGQLEKMDALNVEKMATLPENAQTLDQASYLRTV